MTERELTIADLTTGKTCIRMFTGNLRWRGYVLEQEVAEVDYEDGNPKDRRTEWCAVPHVDGEEGNKK